VLGNEDDICNQTLDLSEATPTDGLTTVIETQALPLCCHSQMQKPNLVVRQRAPSYQLDFPSSKLPGPTEHGSDGRKHPLTALGFAGVSFLNTKTTDVQIML